MTTLREAAQMALEALNNLKTREPVDEEIAVLRAALASQTVPSDCSYSHQPDSWRTEARNDLGLPVFFCASEVKQAGPGLIPLYTAPPLSMTISGDCTTSRSSTKLRQAEAELMDAIDSLETAIDRLTIRMDVCEPPMTKVLGMTDEDVVKFSRFLQAELNKKNATSV